MDEFVRKRGAWTGRSHEAGVVISSRVRLARNLMRTRFPGWADEAQRVKLCTALREALGKVSSLKEAIFLEMGGLDPADRDVLRERHLISQELAERGAGSALMVSADEQIAIMINEEDHLRMQVLAPGLDLQNAWLRLNALDSELEAHIRYAFSHRLGYLAACPSNVGTGLRASVMMHLPGLKLMEEVEPAMNGLEKIGFTVRGLWGEGTEAYGNVFQISNQSSLGESEQSILDGLIRVAEEVQRHEQNARARLMEDRQTYLLDHLGRAVGILLHARILPSREAIELLSAVRMGAEMGLFQDIDAGRVNELMLLTQPGHLQKIMRKSLESQERDELRAKIVSAELRKERTAEHARTV